MKQFNHNHNHIRPLRLPAIAFFSLLAISLGMLTSCEDHDEVYDSTVRVGNIYLADHRVVSPEGYNPKTDDAVGVIFYAHADTALVVSTRELGRYIYSDSIGAIENVTNDAVSRCGQQNTAAIRASEFSKHCPALRALDTHVWKVTGWSLPSAGDLRALSAALTSVSHAMETIGGDAFTREQYFSSSQDGTTSASTQENYYTVSLATGSITSSFKGESSRLRPVLMVTR